MIPIVIFSILFNIPKFLEGELNWITEQNEHGKNITKLHPLYPIEPTELRMHEHYSFYYINLISLIVKGTIHILRYHLYWGPGGESKITFDYKGWECL